MRFGTPLLLGSSGVGKPSSMPYFPPSSTAYAKVNSRGMKTKQEQQFREQWPASVDSMEALTLIRFDPPCAKKIDPSHDLS